MQKHYDFINILLAEEGGMSARSHSQVGDLEYMCSPARVSDVTCEWAKKLVIFTRHGG